MKKLIYIPEGLSLYVYTTFKQELGRNQEGKKMCKKLVDAHSIIFVLQDCCSLTNVQVKIDEGALFPWNR